jgi:hypothetical protein
MKILIFQGDSSLQAFNRSRKNSFELFQQNSEGIFGQIRSSTIK